jgi:hypothetical protein
MGPKTLLPSRRGWLAALLCTAALTTGFLIGWPGFGPAATLPTGPRNIPVAYAVDCQAANTACINGTTTSLLNVLHQKLTYDSESARWVEPDDTDSWEITAEWRAAPPCDPGDVRFEAASVDVTWSGSAWVLSNINLTNSIVDIDICTTSDTCSGTGGTHAYGYKLIVDVNDPDVTQAFNLVRVKYETTQIDDGRLILFDPGPTPTCNNLGAAVSPTSQTFVQYDSGPWNSSRCTYSCSTGGGSPSMAITYQ